MEGEKDELYIFLRHRGFEEDKIESLKNEKIDTLALKSMPDEHFTTLFPKLGDQFAVRGYCKLKTETNTNPRKQSLIERLKSKINGPTGTKSKSNDHSLFNASTSSEGSPQGVRLKPTRKIELGWLCMRKDGELKQVRSNLGGGTRKVEVSKNSTKEDLLKIAMDFFFPNGSSTMGAQSSFDIDLLDFQQNEILDDLTVGEIYLQTGLPMLRFYLATKIKPTQESPTPSVSNEVEIETEIVYDKYDYSQSFEVGPSFGEENLIAETIGEHPSSSTEKTRKLTLHRGNVMRELIQYFIEPIPEKINIEMILENGEIERAIDAGGVFRDCLSEFWETFYDLCTNGTRMKIPVLRHDFQEKEWCSVANIIAKGWKEVKYFPIQIAPAFMEFCIFGKIESDLKETLLKILSPADENVVRSALTEFSSVELDEIIEVFSTLESKWVPNAHNLETLFSDIARKEVIQKGKFIVDCWSTVLKDLMEYHQFSTLHSKLAPTSRNILSLLQCSLTEDLDSEKIRVFGFLKKLVREADEGLLAKFLRFTTGADVITTSSITVEFTNENGLKRLPVSHSCTCMLQLSKNYDNFTDFRSEFNNVLRSNVWIMDIA